MFNFPVSIKVVGTLNNIVGESSSVYLMLQSGIWSVISLCCLQSLQKLQQMIADKMQIIYSLFKKKIFLFPAEFLEASTLRA